jgi:hypothetical protein
MNCPPEMASILLRLIGVGILRIRAYSHDPGRCAAEADHIHDLPDLVLSDSPRKLSYYWDVERPSFIEQATTADRATGFEPIWVEPRAHAESHAVAGTS